MLRADAGRHRRVHRALTIRRFDGARDLLDLRVEGADGRDVRGVLDPSLVRVSTDPGGTSIIVAAPGDSIPLIDRLVSVLDQSPVEHRLAIRKYDLEHARARDLSNTLQQLFDAQRQGPGASDLPRVRLIPDERTNSLLVTASDSQHREVERLLAAADGKTPDDGLELRGLALGAADYLRKPVPREVLLARVRRVLDATAGADAP